MIDQAEQDRLDALQDELTEEALEAKTTQPMAVDNRNSVYTLRNIIVDKVQANQKTDE